MSDMEEVEYDYDDAVGNHSDSDDDINNNFQAPSSESTTKPSTTTTTTTTMAQHALRQSDFRCLTDEGLKGLQQSVILQVAEVLSISEDQAAVLLLSYKWDKERLDETFWSDPEQTRVKAGAIQGRVAWLDPTKLKSQFYCPILMEEIPYERTLSMGCEPQGQLEHRFSIDAWSEYLMIQLGEGPNCLKITCPNEGCPCVVSPKVWRLIFTAPPVPKPVLLPQPKKGAKRVELDPAAQQALAIEQELNAAKDALTKYERFLAKNFVDINRKIKWCPSPGCLMAVECSVPNAFVQCSGCRTNFCFACRMDSHAPLTCEALKHWDAKCTNETETANWFMANTKCCPKCKTPIEKANGCNHMTCTMVGCRFEFCWTCMGGWTEHGAASGGYYQCNKFDPKANSERLAGSAKAKHQLERYIHYYSRYEGHKSAGKFAEKQRAEAEERMIKYQRTTVSAAASFSERVQAFSAPAGWIDVQFIKDAVEQLIECRRVLMYTYAFAYYLKDTPRKELFEYNQAMLEANTEKLSELSEACDKNPDSVNRTEVINFTRVTGNFLRKVLEDVQMEEMDVTY